MTLMRKYVSSDVQKRLYEFDQDGGGCVKHWLENDPIFKRIRN
ncbi:hypothetical protein CAEBREN_32080 [Caenorhabditis brenneri]|uniref:Uncharacterized protein n=1 Tax=Caenorhabditis brenneri TaxID=135651 RepID=G0P5S2_CAEBE|nr:hypothetical protein CAEBREN_32080 [Caenorhabditis brenneri]